LLAHFLRSCWFAPFREHSEDFWQDEKECRVILAEPPASPDEPVLKNQKLFFGDQLIGIIFGSRVSREHRDEILALLNPLDHLPLYVARGGVPYNAVQLFELKRANRRT